MSKGSVVAIGVGALVIAFTGCGAEDHANELRPPSPIALAATVNDEEVLLSEDEVGGGLANVTVSNQSSEEVELTFDGPSDAARPAPLDAAPGRGAVSVVVTAGSTGALKLNLEEGVYEVSAGTTSGAESAELQVGPERPSAQNDLLLP